MEPYLSNKGMEQVIQKLNCVHFCDEKKASASPHFFSNLLGFAQTQYRCEVLLI